VISDLRFFHEAEELRAMESRGEAKVTLIRVTRPGIAQNEFSLHPSEKDIPLIEVDIDIMNDGTMDDLYSKLSNLYKK
jgi:hypothetical protein